MSDNYMLKPRRERMAEVLIHVACWLFVLVIPFFGMIREEDPVSFYWSLYIHHCEVVFMCMCVVYINYLYLLPKLFIEKKRMGLFWVANIVIVLVLAALLQLVPKTMVPADAMPLPDFPMEGDEHTASHPYPHHHPTFLPRYFLFYMRDLSFLCLAFVIGTSVKLGLYYRHKELQYQRLEKAQIETELQNLRYQINPHFLLNTLNNIYALIELDSPKAQKSILELSKMLRYVLYDNQPFVQLTHEVAFLKNYIDLMLLRVTSNVEVHANFEVADDSTTKVAPMMFISLVENAFKHGISPKRKCGINIDLTENDGIITCEVRNCNHPKTDKDKSGSGVGLTQLRRRLDLIYPDKYTWEVTISDDKKIYNSKLTINTKS